jgi:hypothetical protein
VGQGPDAAGLSAHQQLHGRLLWNYPLTALVMGGLSAGPRALDSVQAAAEAEETRMLCWNTCIGLTVTVKLLPRSHAQ